MEKFNSKNLMHYPILKNENACYVSILKIEETGVIGYHQATSDQLFIIVEGNGWVRTKETDKISVREGDFIYWKCGEWHETGTENEMTGLVIEGTKFELFQNIQD